MKKIFVLSALTLLTVGLLSNPSTPVNKVNDNNDIEEVALDLNNESLLKLDARQMVVGDSELDVSDTYVQFGMIEENGKDLYVMRFATAVKGDLSSVTYTRAAVEGKDANTAAVTTLYKGISAGAETYYYNGSELTTDESSAGNYYWACYTVKYNNGSFYNVDLPVSITVNEVETKILTTSFDAEYAKVEDGSEAYPYLIATNEELEWVASSSKQASTYTKHYKLVSNLSTSSQISSSSYNFSGTFDGNGYSITVNQNKIGERLGLFYTISRKFNY